MLAIRYLKYPNATNRCPLPRGLRWVSHPPLRLAVVSLALLLLAAPHLSPASADAKGWQVDRSYGDAGTADLGPNAEGLGLVKHGRGLLIRRSNYYDVFPSQKVNLNGSLDRSFGSGNDGSFDDAYPYFYARRYDTDMVTLPDGGIVQSSNLRPEGPPFYAAMGVAKFDSVGRPDRSFGKSGKYYTIPRSDRNRFSVNALAAEKDGSILAAGTRTWDKYRRLSANEFLAIPLTWATVTKLTPAGKLDRSFGKNGRFQYGLEKGRTLTDFTDVKVLANGKLLAAGYADGHAVLVRIKSNGRLDRTFGRNGTAVGYGGSTDDCYQTFECYDFENTVEITIAPGRIYVGNNSERKSDWSRTSITAFNSSGRRVESFGNKGTVRFRRVKNGHRTFFATDLKVKRNGKLVLLGAKLSKLALAKPWSAAAMRLLPSGERDLSFGPRGIFSFRVPNMEIATDSVPVAGGKQLIGGLSELYDYELGRLSVDARSVLLTRIKP